MSKFAGDEKPVCTCEHDHDEQTASLDPACPIHGNGAEITTTVIEGDGVGDLSDLLDGEPEDGPAEHEAEEV